MSQEVNANFQDKDYKTLDKNYTGRDPISHFKGRTDKMCLLA